MQNKNESLFSWGEEVYISKKAPLEIRPGELVFIVGVMKADTKFLQKEYQVAFGEALYTIEYMDGTDRTLSGKYLSRNNKD